MAQTYPLGYGLLPDINNDNIADADRFYPICMMDFFNFVKQQKISLFQTLLVQDEK